MTRTIRNSSWIWISMFIIILGTITEAQPIGNTFASNSNATNDIKDTSEHNITTLVKIQNCSIVFGYALVGGAIVPIAIALVLLLVFCVCGFPCCGIMIAAAYRKSRKSSKENVPDGRCKCPGWLKYAFIIVCIIGIPIGLCSGGFIANHYFHCFPDN